MECNIPFPSSFFVNLSCKKSSSPLVESEKPDFRFNSLFDSAFFPSSTVEVVVVMVDGVLLERRLVRAEGALSMYLQIDQNKQIYSSLIFV